LAGERVNDHGETTTLILASGSSSRGNLLNHAGVRFAVKPAAVDEETVRAARSECGASAEDTAMTLAELKAVRISRDEPQALVIGADQILDLDGDFLAKPRDVEDARGHLQRLRGRTHSLATAVCVVEDGERVWGHIDSPRLAIRDFSTEFLDHYLTEVGEEMLSSVGAYQLEGRGAQLFSHIEGDYFSILGLPLIPLLSYLRIRGVLV
jgi:septum formation protein